jgi:hypothetical protein
MIENLRTFLDSMLRPRGFYILGAGASSGLVPFTPELRDEIKRTYWSIGMYPATAAPRTELFKRVVAGYQGGAFWDSQEAALQHITTGALDLLVQKQLSYPLRQAIPAQYQFLRSVGAPSLFFSFNLDGLAKACLGDVHVVLEPHGTVDREWTEAPDFDTLLEWALDIELPHLRPKLLPGPEPTSITGSVPYLRARNWIRRAPSVSLIGYSFGKNDRGHDDEESFEYVIEHVTATSCVLFVVSPDPFELAALIEERLRSKRVLPVALYWDVFTKAAASLARLGRGRSGWLYPDSLRALERSYHEGLELAA